MSVVQLILETGGERGGDGPVMCSLGLGSCSPERLSDLRKVPRCQELNPDTNPHPILTPIQSTARSGLASAQKAFTLQVQPQTTGKKAQFSYK